MGPVEFEWNAKILSAGPIARIFAPNGAQVQQLTEERTQYLVKLDKVHADMKIMYRTPDIMKPSVAYARQEGSDQVAIMASLVPSFEVLHSEETKIEIGEKPTQPRRRKNGSSYHYIFLIDCSGSMAKNGRMQKAIEALKLFILSLPKGSHFSIIRFGSNHEIIEHNGTAVWTNKGTVRDEIIELVSQMKHNLGGTNIETPLKLAQEGLGFNPEDQAGLLMRRIFVLTDGQVQKR